MSVKMTGAEWKRFYNDEAFWPEFAYHEDESMTVNGEETAWDHDRSTVPDDAVLVLSGGVFFRDVGDDGRSLEAYFKKWRKTQSTVSIVCEAPKDKADAIKAAIRAAGGKVA